MAQTLNSSVHTLKSMDKTLLKNAALEFTIPLTMLFNKKLYHPTDNVVQQKIVSLEQF